MARKKTMNKIINKNIEQEKYHYKLMVAVVVVLILLLIVFFLVRYNADLAGKAISSELNSDILTEAQITDNEYVMEGATLNSEEKKTNYNHFLVSLLPFVLIGALIGSVLMRKSLPHHELMHGINIKHTGKEKYNKFSKRFK